MRKIKNPPAKTYHLIKKSILFVFAALVSWTPASAAVLEVCANGAPHTTISSALDVAAAGDTIEICAGILTENLIDITQSVTLRGAGKDATIIQSAPTRSFNNFAMFLITGGGTVRFEGLTIRHSGEVVPSGGARRGIQSVGTDLEIIDSRITGHLSFIRGSIGVGSASLLFRRSELSNSGAFSDGGALAIGGASSTLIVEDSTFSDNSGFDVGAISLNSIASASITGSTFFDNRAEFGAGAILSRVTTDLTITNSTFRDNEGGDSGGPGGIDHSLGHLALTNSTFSRNEGGESSTGGAIFIGSRATAHLSHVTVTNNFATLGGSGISNHGSLTITNSIVADNPGVVEVSADCFNTGTFNALGANLSSDDTCPGFSLAMGNAALGPLADNGGPTQTHAPGIGSDAIDASATDCTASDQRGILRPQGAGCDLGAVEIAECPCVEQDPLFADLVLGASPILSCQDQPDNTALLAELGGGTGAFSGTKGGRPNQCGTFTLPNSFNVRLVTPGEDESCRALIRMACSI